jgi:hypothetical protein
MEIVGDPGFHADIGARLVAVPLTAPRYAEAPHRCTMRGPVA